MLAGYPIRWDLQDEEFMKNLSLDTQLRLLEQECEAVRKGEHLIVHEYTNAILNRKEEQLHFAQLFRDFQYSSIMKLHEMEVGEAEEIFEQGTNEIRQKLLQQAESRCRTGEKGSENRMITRTLRNKAKLDHEIIVPPIERRAARKTNQVTAPPIRNTLSPEEIEYDIALIKQDWQERTNKIGPYTGLEFSAIPIYTNRNFIQVGEDFFEKGEKVVIRTDFEEDVVGAILLINHHEITIRSLDNSRIKIPLSVIGIGKSTIHHFVER